MTGSTTAGVISPLYRGTGFEKSRSGSVVPRLVDAFVTGKLRTCACSHLCSSCYFLSESRRSIISYLSSSVKSVTLSWHYSFREVSSFLNSPLSLRFGMGKGLYAPE